MHDWVLTELIDSGAKGDDDVRHIWILKVLIDPLLTHREMACPELSKMRWRILDDEERKLGFLPPQVSSLESVEKIVSYFFFCLRQRHLGQKSSQRKSRVSKKKWKSFNDDDIYVKRCLLVLSKGLNVCWTAAELALSKNEYCYSTLEFNNCFWKPDSGQKATRVRARVADIGKKGEKKMTGRQTQFFPRSWRMEE